jgi:hypothetical protein
MSIVFSYNRRLASRFPRWSFYIPNLTFSVVENPYRARDSATEDDFASVVRYIQKKRGVRINWPGDSVKVDFVKLYQQGLLC